VSDDNTAAWFGSGGSGGSDDGGVPSGEEFVTDSGTGVQWGRLAAAVFSTLLLAVSGLWISVIETLVQWQVFLINGLGSFVASLISAILGGGAGLVVESWRAAAIQAVEAGPFAPILLALEAVIILTIAFAIWERRPFA